MAPLEQNGLQANGSGHPALERISSGLEADSPDANTEMRNCALQRYGCALLPLCAGDAVLAGWFAASLVLGL